MTTTILIIAASILFLYLISRNISLLNQNQDLREEIKMSISEFDILMKKYHFLHKESMSKDIKIIELQKKANKYDKELERQRIKNSNYRTKKQLKKTK